MARPFIWSSRPLPFFFLSGIFFLLFVTVLPGLTGPSFSLDPDTISRAEKKYGPEAGKRLLAWQALIRENSGRDELEKLALVNCFFNRLDFLDDIIHWQKKDYWATPVEFLASGGGDCEDFTLAKYFTLKAMGISEEKMNMIYVKAVRLNQAHMVLGYYPSPGAEPLILDNLVPTIEPASKRTDLLPVYSFNGVGLWLAKQRGRGKLVGNSDRLKRWQELLERMPVSLH
jgi:predicted transglutaminase-like cysteine proteinase